MYLLCFEVLLQIFKNWKQKFDSCIKNMIYKKSLGYPKKWGIQEPFLALSKRIASIALAKMLKRTLGCRIFATNAINKSITTI